MRFEGRAWKFGGNVDTDVIIPAKYLSATDAAELGEHCMEGLRPDFSRQVAKGDIIVALDNFGCGSSREHAPMAIKGCGLACVVASSFARIFYRNAINTGLPIIESAEAASSIEDGDRLLIDMDAGKLIDVTKGTSFTISSYPGFIREIISDGGLMEYIRKRYVEGKS